MAQQTRNVAGLVTKRRTDQVAATGPMPWIESNWAYDTLGRVTSQTVQKGANVGGAPEQVAKQVLSYLGNDDPSTLVHTLGPATGVVNTKTFTFGYDLRHQLTSADAAQSALGAAPYVSAGTSFSGTYGARYFHEGLPMKSATVICLIACGCGHRAQQKSVEPCKSAELISFETEEMKLNCRNAPRASELTTAEMNELASLLTTTHAFANLPVYLEFEKELNQQIDPLGLPHSPTAARYVDLTNKGFLSHVQPSGLRFYRVYKVQMDCGKRWILRLCSESLE
jgi:hypothetical protein